MGRYKNVGLFHYKKKDKEDFSIDFNFKENNFNLDEKNIIQKEELSKKVEISFKEKKTEINENLKLNEKSNKDDASIEKQLENINKINLKNQKVENSKEYTLEDGIKELEKAKVKFYKNNVKFVIRDKSGQLIWLEEGNDLAGLKHILDEHALDFCNKFKIEEKEIINLIKDILLKSEIVYFNKGYRNGILCLTKIYLYHNEYYVLGGIGTNGFISSFYPIGEEDYESKIKGAKNEKKRD